MRENIEKLLKLYLCPNNEDIDFFPNNNCKYAKRDIYNSNLYHCRLPHNLKCSYQKKILAYDLEFIHICELKSKNYYKVIK